MPADPPPRVPPAAPDALSGGAPPQRGGPASAGAPLPSTPAPSAPLPSTPAPSAPLKPWYARAFSLTPGQALRLLGISTLTGFFVLAFDYAPAGATFDIGGALTAIVHRALTAIGWAFESFWKPALAGAAVVVPLWALWRLARLPFRK